MRKLKIIISIALLAYIIGWSRDENSFIHVFVIKTFWNAFFSVDGGFGEWSEWTQCSTKCGTGQSIRYRKCDNPAPISNGHDCIGERRQEKSCANYPCKVDGGLSTWSSWSVCSKTCGGGYHKRVRKCDHPPPSNGGEFCRGELEESKACVNNLCKDVSGIAKVQEKVKSILTILQEKHKKNNNSVSGKFYKSMFVVQKTVADEFSSVDPTAKGKTLEKRLDDLERYLKIATEEGSITFARTLLGKGIYTYTQQKIKEGIPIDNIDVAASAYLDKLRQDIGSERMDKILSSQGDATLMFAIDTTSSMHEEINSAKAIARQIIDVTRTFDVDYILSPFNDPGVGPVTYRSSKEKVNFVSAINSLTIDGGGDCPELAFKGMLNAFDQGPKFGSPMFVFTDASAKDDTVENMAALKSAAEMSGASISFFANLDGCGRGIDSFRDIASATSGLVFPLQSELELLKFAEYVKVSLEQDTLITSGSQQNHEDQVKTCTFNVDSGIEKLVVSVAVSKQNSAVKVQLYSPSGENMNAKSTMSMARIFEIQKPKEGVWKLSFPKSVGKYDYSVQAVSNAAIEFSYGFIYQESPSRDSPLLSLENPIKGRENMMILQIGGTDNIETTSLNVDVVDTHGQVRLSNLEVKPMDSRDVYNTSFTPPDIPFKIRFKGKTKSGGLFERISRGITRPTNLHMRPTYAGDEFTAALGGGEIAVQMQLLNIGEQDVFSFKISSITGSVSPASQSKSIRNMGFLNFEYTPPDDSSNGNHGRVERITVTAKQQGSGETFSKNINVLLVKK